MTTKPIVVGTDGSRESIGAVEWAAREAHLRGAGLSIVSAAELLPRMMVVPRTTGTETVSSVIRRNRDGALATAAKAAAQIAPDVLIDTDVLEGAPAQAVTDAGEGALMLVVGSRGHGAFVAMTLGSVSRYAATHAHCPVVVVREESGSTRPQVVVGIRDPRDCAATLGLAVEEAALRSASLTVVHAWHAPRIGEPPIPGYVQDSILSPTADEIEENVARQLEEPLAAWLDKYPGVTASLDVVHGHPGRVLAGMSARADLVVLGRRGTGRAVHAVLSHAHGPVLVAPSA